MCVERRYLELKPATRARISPELVACAIRRARGDVWPAVLELGVSYRHALEIRAGWRGDGRQAEPIPRRADNLRAGLA